MRLFKPILTILFCSLLISAIQPSYATTSPHNERLYVERFAPLLADWNTYGASPYLNDSSANYVYTDTHNSYMEVFGFAYTSLNEVGTIENIKLNMEVRCNVTDRNDTVAIVLKVKGWQIVDYLDPDNTAYQWFSWDITSLYTPTWNEVNATRLRLVYQKVGAGSSSKIYIIRAYLNVNYSMVAITFFPIYYLFGTITALPLLLIPLVKRRRENAS